MSKTIINVVIVAMLLPLMITCKNNGSKESTKRNTADTTLKSQMTPETHNISIEKVGNTWKVVDDQPKKYGLVVNQGDTLIWQTTTDVFFQFPINYRKWFKDLPGVNPGNAGYRRSLDANSELVFTVKPTAPRDTISYAVLVIEDVVLAEGDSVPTVEVD